LPERELKRIRPEFIAKYRTPSAKGAAAAPP